MAPEALFFPAAFELNSYLAVLDEAERGSHQDLSTLNGALDGLESEGSAGRREWLERRLWASPASPNHLQRGGGGGAVMLSNVVGKIGG